MLSNHNPILVIAHSYVFLGDKAYAVTSRAFDPFTLKEHLFIPDSFNLRKEAGKFPERYPDYLIFRYPD